MVKILEFIKGLLKKNYLKLILAFSFFFLCFWLTYFSVEKIASLDDAFFHIRFAEIIRENGLLNSFENFNWIYFSEITEGNYFVYYNFLFYLLLLPFTLISPLLLGIKAYAVFAAAIGLVAIYYFLLSIGEKYPFVWTLAVFALTSHIAIWRWLLSRPFTLAPVFLLLLILFLYKKKKLPVFLISFLYLFWHSATFFFPAVIASIYIIFQAFYRQKIAWKIWRSVILGFLGGLLLLFAIAPGFNRYVLDVLVGVFSDTILGEKVNIPEGGELYPLDFFQFIKRDLWISTLLIIAIVVEIFSYIRAKRNRETLVAPDRLVLRGTLFFLSISLFLGTTLMSQRYGDFFVFFVSVYLALSLQDIFAIFKAEDQYLKRAVYVGAIIAIVYLFGGNFLFLQQQISIAAPYNAIEPAARWLDNNIPDEEIVYQSDWSWFPTLFYYNSNNYYIAGLEPRFLYDYDKNLYWKWSNISRLGYVCNQPECKDKEILRSSFAKKEDRSEWYDPEGNLIAETLINDFKSKYILTSADYPRFLDILNNNHRFELVHTSSQNPFVIYHVIDEKNT